MSETLTFTVQLADSGKKTPGIQVTYQDDQADAALQAIIAEYQSRETADLELVKDMVTTAWKRRKKVATLCDHEVRDYRLVLQYSGSPTLMPTPGTKLNVPETGDDKPVATA